MDLTFEQKYNIKLQNTRRFRFNNFAKTEALLPDDALSELNYDLFFCSFKDVTLTKRIDTSSCFSMIQTFADCRNLTRITYLSELDTKYVENMTGIFSNDKYLQDYTGIENWDVSKCKSFAQAFENSGITSLRYFKNWKLKNASCEGMFRSSALMTLDGLNEIDLSEVTSTAEMFANLSITSLKGSENLDLSNVKNPTRMFSNNKNLKNFLGSETWKLPQGVTLSNIISTYSVNAVYVF